MAAEPRQQDETLGLTLSGLDRQLRTAALQHASLKTITFYSVPGFNSVICDAYDNVTFNTLALTFCLHTGQGLSTTTVRHKVPGTTRSSAVLHPHTGLREHLGFHDDKYTTRVFGLGYCDDSELLRDFVLRVARFLHTALKHGKAETVIKHTDGLGLMKIGYTFFVSGSWWSYETRSSSNVFDMTITEQALADAEAAGLRVFDGR